MRKIKEGDKFNRLTFIRQNKRTGSGRRKGDFLCECGNIKNTEITAVMRLEVKSCGCLVVEETRKHSLKHGLCYTRFYHIWRNMINRCTDINHDSYHYYGGRGIRVCNRWLKFENFMEDMYEFYLNHVKDFTEKSTTLDRINSNGNYEPSNCKWSTPKQQGNNRLNNYLITYKGNTKTFTQWSEFLGIKISTLYSRLVRKWSIERVFETPVRRI